VVVRDKTTNKPVPSRVCTLLLLSILGVQVMHVFNEALADRKSPSIKVSYLSESSHTMQNGEAMVVHVLINATPMKDVKGVIYGVLGIAQDISDSRCVDLHLQRARVNEVCLLLYARYTFCLVCGR